MKLKKQFFLLFGTFFVFFLFGEVILRIYYAYNDQIIAKDEYEYCLKELKYKLLPSDGRVFKNFTRTDRWDYDPLIGATSKKNFSKASPVAAFESGVKKTGVWYEQHHHNSQGMSNIEEFSLKKSQNVSLRIALFGDSFTCGDEVPLLYSMGYLLQTFIPNSEVLNFCVSGRGIDTMFARYMLEGKNYSPDIVFFNFLIDDLMRPYVCPLETPNLSIENGVVKINQRQYPTPQSVYENYTAPVIESYFFKHFMYLYDYGTRRERNMKKGLGLLDHILNTLQKETKKRNTALFASLIQAPAPDSLQKEYYEKTKKIILQKNISLFDSQEYFENQNEEYHNMSFYYQRGKQKLGHFNVVGNAIFAQGMKQFLEQQKILKQSHNYYFASIKDAKALVLFEQGNETPRYVYPFLFDKP